MKMFDLVFRSPDSYVDSCFESLNKEERIRIGTKFKDLEHKIFVTHNSLALKKFLPYNNLTDFINDNVEYSLTHEVIHILLYRIGGNPFTYAFDKIDANYEISKISELT